jgi:hypothetical protein
MAWKDNGNLTNSIVLMSRRQPVPVMIGTNGLFDCLNQPVSSNNWQSSYTLTIPSNWVSGVYVARLTTGTNVTPQTTGKQSYIIFVVREDARSSDLLYQASVTTWQAYNPWGGSSIYPYPSRSICNPASGESTGGTVSFNRPYAGATCNAYLHYGAGAGEFFTLINNGGPGLGWECNMVRWLERQGYDVAYSTSIDTHRACPANKGIKAFLSVGHDEYWSGMMRTNVESARDRGVNLGFFCANCCYWQIHFDTNYPNERVFSINKINEVDLWGRGYNQLSGDLDDRRAIRRHPC